MKKLHGAALALGGQGPGEAGLVVDLVDPGAACIAQGQGLPVIVEAALPGAQRVLYRQVPGQDHGVLGDHEIAATVQHRSLGEPEDDPIGKIPA